MKTVLLATTPAKADLFGSEIDTWTAKRKAEGLVVRVHETTATSGYSLRDEYAALPTFDTLFELGDLPQILHFVNADGHGQVWLPCPHHKVNRDSRIEASRQPGTDNCTLQALLPPPYASVGRLTFDGLAGFSAGQITDQYRRWFARRDAGFAGVPAACKLLDHLNYNPGGDDFRQFGAAIVSQFAKFPKAMTRFSPAVVNGDDGEMRRQEAALIYCVQAGGDNWGDGQYLYYWGRYLDLIDHPMTSPLVSFFGSYMARTTGAGSIVRGALVDRPAPGAKPCAVICSFYNWRGNFVWSEMLAGGTAGDAVLATIARTGFDLDYLHGDPTLVIDAGTLQRLANNELGGEVTEAQFDAAVATIKATFQAQYDDLEKRMVKLEGGPVVVPTLPPTPGIVVTSARYRQVAHPEIFTDVTAKVQALVAAGHPWSVHPGLADPYLNILKELFVQWQKDGGPVQTKVFGQLQAVVLG